MSNNCIIDTLKDTLITNQLFYEKIILSTFSNNFNCNNFLLVNNMHNQFNNFLLEATCYNSMFFDENNNINNRLLLIVKQINSDIVDNIGKKIKIFNLLKNEYFNYNCYKSKKTLNIIDKFIKICKNMSQEIDYLICNNNNTLNNYYIKKLDNYKTIESNHFDSNFNFECKLNNIIKNKLYWINYYVKLICSNTFINKNIIEKNLNENINNNNNNNNKIINNLLNNTINLKINNSINIKNKNILHNNFCFNNNNNDNNTRDNKKNYSNLIKNNKNDIFKNYKFKTYKFKTYKLYKQKLSSCNNIYKYCGNSRKKLFNLNKNINQNQNIIINNNDNNKLKIFDITKQSRSEYLQSFKTKETISNEKRKIKKTISLSKTGNNISSSVSINISKKKIYYLRIDCIKKRIKTFVQLYIYNKLSYYLNKKNSSKLKNYIFKLPKAFTSNISVIHMKKLFNTTIKDIYCKRMSNFKKEYNEHNIKVINSCTNSLFLNFVNKTYKEVFLDYQTSSDRLQHIKKVNIMEGLKYANLMNDNISCFIDNYKC